MFESSVYFLPACKNSVILCSVTLRSVFFLALLSISWAPVYAESRAIEGDRAVSSELQNSYRFLHQHPELGKKEFKTAEFIRSKLKEYGFKDLLSVESAPTTVIAVLDGSADGPCICFRAEMDARGCEEESGLPFASTVSGLMHNCGHDAHTAMLLETAKRLIKIRDKLKGKIVFLFQPAEECAGGADDIVNDGILKRLNVQAVFAQHCASKLPAGKHTLVEGAALAGATNITVEINGRGGHAAQMHERDDLAGLAALMILELERLPSRVTDLLAYPTVLSISSSTWSSHQANVAPQKIVLKGSIRTFYGINERLFNGKSLKEQICQLVEGLSMAYGVKSAIELKNAAPVTINDPDLCKRVKTLLSEAGIEVESQEKCMFSEDFSYYTQYIPCAYFGLGIAGDGRGMDNPHSSRFTIDERCLESGVSLFMNIARAVSEKGLK